MKEKLALVPEGLNQTRSLWEGILFTLGLLIPMFFSAESLKLSLHLGKDTLVLAEPVLVRAQMTNLTGNELLIDNIDMFGLVDGTFRLFVITPYSDGEDWCLRLSYSIGYSPMSSLFFKLQPGKSASQQWVLWWPQILPKNYREALEEIKPGGYKMYATYRVPDQSGFDRVTIYSDTADFVFQPLEEKNLSALKQMDSIAYVFLAPASNASYPRFERIRNTNTPYSESAWMMTTVMKMRDYDSLKAEKALFDKVYPQSQFASVLMELQYDSYGHFLYMRDGIKAYPDDAEADSLLRSAREITPNTLYILKARGEVELVSGME